jgi:LDH2 family malate/lactate/ureidoglycolate dehydrogenase
MEEVEATYRVSADTLRDFCTQVFMRLDVPEEDAQITADVLVEADLRGVASHGVARLRRYVSGLQTGMMNPRPAVQVLVETPTTAALDADAGLGQPVSYRAMLMAIEKARELGVGLVTVRNSNHYGIAGYYAMMALEEDMIGMSMTNTDVLVVPTFGRDALLGTNPIAVAIPAGEELPYVLDMATSIVPRGKLEVYHRLGKKMPLGWATDEEGVATDDPGRVLHNLTHQLGGGLLPLGGEGELMGGHKGYGLALLVELLCGVLSGAAYMNLTYPKDEKGRPLPSNIGHIFGAVRIDAFMPVDEFKARMDDAIRRLHNSSKAKGQTRIWVHGEKEFEQTEQNLAAGVPLHVKVFNDLQAIAQELDVPFPFEGE